ncbi:zinc finger CCCH domain-containing protein 19-like isoform X2 [Hordeum vulgare subsp. vulgare]|uniref:zinc finger CCCH domain-containing protein 19-like isoform X2 n=1 Tax=Hordeum vulgare subsp. vulgare TaxID=112509 RepID=UPI001D1A52A8|nr:zinc finger CCCH domain-containing protein 19-like isoform X2 [Hordeum vulgare subsp. vulgare]
MDAGTGPAGEMLSPGEAEWPPELRLPPPPPMPEPAPPAPHRLTAWLHAPPASSKEPSPPRHTEGFDDSHFLGSIMEAADGAGAGAVAMVQQQQGPAVDGAAAAAPVEVKRKRGRPRKNRDGAVAAPAPPKPVKKNDEEEVVCFICFDGGSLVVCDRRGCSKVYHPACIKRDESFFRSRGKWNCGWHICSSCEKAVQYMCYTCTYSLCKGCVKQGKFFGVRGNKGFCDTCYATILLIESKDEDATKVMVDFDDKNSWEYLFKLYWLDVKGKHLLTLEELISAKSNWTVQSISARREKEESSGERYDAHNDHDVSSDSSLRKRSRGTSLRKRGRKRQNHSVNTARNCEISIKGSEGLPKGESMDLSGDTKWASPELLEFIGYIRNGDMSQISQFDVQVLLLEYIKQNNLRDPRKKSQIICDARLSSLFRKPCVGHFEMLKLLEIHFHVKETPALNGDTQAARDLESAQVDSGGHTEMGTKLSSDKRRKTHKKLERDLPANLEDYAAIDMHNINLIYLRRSLMEDIIDDVAAFSEKITGAFVRIRIPGSGQKQDMYRLVKVLGTHKVAEQYSVGKKTTNRALEISNLDKKEVITMDTISNQDFTQDECKRLRQSMKYGLIPRLKVGDIYEIAKSFQYLQINDWLVNEKQRLSHLRDRASETGRRKELRECVEKLQLLNTPEEIARKINEVPEVHVDPYMAPTYESAEEWNDETTVDLTINRNGPDFLFPGREGTESNAVQYLSQKCSNASRHSSLNPPTEGVTHIPGAGTITNLQAANGWNIPRPRIDLNNTAGEAASVPSSGVVSSDTEPEKVWHYRDPSGNVQGPFTLSQLSKWTTYFPSGMKIWLTFESEENSLLLTEVLSTQQKDTIQPTPVINNNKSAWAGSGQDRINPSMTENITSPIDYNVVYSSGLPSQSSDRPPLRRESPNFMGEALPSTTGWEPLTSSVQIQHQANYSCTIPSFAGSYRSPGSHGDGVPREKIREHNNRQETVGLCSSTPPSRSHNSQSTMKPQTGVCTSSSSKTEEIMNLQNPCPPDASNASVNQPFELKIDSVLSPGTQDQYPNPTPKLERKQPVMNKSGSTSVAPEDSATKAYGHSSIALVSEASGLPSSKFVGLQLLKETQTSCVEERDLKDGGCVTQTEQLKGDATSAEACDVLESLTGQNCGTYNVHAGTPLENFAPASAEEERPQCSSPIALSPWGEPSYYQGGAVDSALWGVQDDPSNDMWSLSSPTPALQPSSDLGADGKYTSCIIEEAVVARGNRAVEISPTPEEKKTEKSNPSASTDCGVPEQVKLKPSAALLNSSLKSTEASGGQPSGSSLEGSTKASDRQPSGSSLEGSTKASGRQPVGSFLDGNTKVSGRQVPGPFLERSTKVSGWQLGSSLETGTKGSGWDSSVDGSTKGSGRGLSVDVSTKDSGWGSSLEGSTKCSGWGSSLEGSTKASGWLRSSSSPEGRKTPGRHSSARESSKVNSTSASQNRNSSSGHQTTTPTARSSSEAQRRQGSTNSSSAGWGEAPGNNKSWHPSPGSASRGSQSNQHRDRYSQGNDSRRGSYQNNESRRGSSNHSRRSEHRQDHGSGVSSRSSSRGQPQRGICKYYENGHCWKGPSCYYVHR